MRLRARHRLGKYRILRHLDSGGFAEVYDVYLKEIRLDARLDHPKILPIKNAELIDGRLVNAHPLAEPVW